MKCKIYNEAIWSACWRLFGVGGSCVGDVNLIADDDVSGEEMRALKKSIQTTRTTTCHNGHYRTSFQWDIQMILGEILANFCWANQICEL